MSLHKATPEHLSRDCMSPLSLGLIMLICAPVPLCVGWAAPCCEHLHNLDAWVLTTASSFRKHQTNKMTELGMTDEDSRDDLINIWFLLNNI